MKKIAYILFNGEFDNNINFYKEMFEKNPGDIYCADGGANFLSKLNVIPKAIFGDMDSIEVSILNKYRELGVDIKIFPTDKDFTDSELILMETSDKDYDELIGLFAVGGRTDHFLSNLNLLFKYKKLSFISSSEEIFLLESKTKISNKKNLTISLIPFSDEVSNLSLKGFKYELENATIKRGDSTCMSNIVIDNSAFISFEKGLLIGVISKCN